MTGVLFLLHNDHIKYFQIFHCQKAQFQRLSGGLPGESSSLILETGRLVKWMGGLYGRSHGTLESSKEASRAYRLVCQVGGISRAGFMTRGAQLEYSAAVRGFGSTSAAGGLLQVFHGTEGPPAAEDPRSGAPLGTGPSSTWGPILGNRLKAGPG